MYYSAGNYEAFATPQKPANVDGKSAYIVGSGLAALSAACYLVRDAQMKGEHVHILEKDPIPGGACDGYHYENLGYVMRGGREMDNHFECMWDLFRSIPSIEDENHTVLDEYYWLNKADPNYSLCRATRNRGEDAHTDGKFGLSDKAAMEIMRLFMTPDEGLYDKKITDFFDDEVLNSNFWMYWRTMFAFENWHSALEMKRYLQRYIHHIGGLPDFTALRFTRYNQYESMILPMVKYLEGFGVQFHYDTKVTNIAFDCAGSKKQATRIDILHDGQESSIDLTENDLVFITNGGCVENSTLGSQDTPAEFKPEIKEGGGWDLWRKIAAQDPSFGHPDKFCYDPELSNWMSATVTTLDQRIVPYIKKICKRDPFSGKVVTGGIVTVTDSNWLLSWTLNRQQQFRDQPKDQHRAEYLHESLAEPRKAGCGQIHPQLPFRAGQTRDIQLLPHQEPHVHDPKGGYRADRKQGGGKPAFAERDRGEARSGGDCRAGRDHRRKDAPAAAADFPHVAFRAHAEQGDRRTTEPVGTHRGQAS